MLITANKLTVTVIILRSMENIYYYDIDFDTFLEQSLLQ